MTPVAESGRTWLAAILLLSLGLNLWGIDFGLAERGPSWHPDEVVGGAIGMARDFTLKPSTFIYGSLHFYQTLAVMVPAYLVTEVLGLPETTQRTAVWLAARGLSAVLGAACVALTFALAHRLFGRVAAIAAALSLALTMGFVTSAHFASVDVPMLFWTMASFLMAARVMTSNRRSDYVLAGVFAGLAAATKYNGGIAIAGLPAAYLLSGARRDHLGLVYGFLASAAAFVVANPSLVFASCEFFEGFIKDNAFNTSLRVDEAGMAARLLHALYVALGAGLFSLVLLAVAYGGVLLLRRSETRPILLIASMVVPFLLLISNVHYASVRHVIPVIPPLLILVGKMTADLFAARRAWLRSSGTVVVVVALSWSALYTVSADLEFANDARRAAADWLERHVPPGSTVELTSYSPNLSRERFDVVVRPKVRELDDTLEDLRRATLYRLLYPIFTAYRSVAEDIGLCPDRRPHYQGWYERVATEEDVSADGFHLGLEGLHTRRPDVLVVSELYYKRWTGDGQSPEGELFAALFAGRTDYRKVAEFTYRPLPWLDPKVQFINPKIIIFAPRQDAAKAD